MKKGLLVAILLSASLEAQQQKFSIHGYVNQAYAVSDEHQIFGIPTDGTTDYRDLALQFRYDPNRKHALVVQFRHQQLGKSPTNRDGVELDWAFYQHNFSDRFSVKAGRIPLPLGIFNEADGAAATSPFFRPPHEFYDRAYASKTVDGVLASVSLGDAAGWSFDVDGYAGRWALDSYRRDGSTTDAKNAWGAQIWANSPLPGVRVGAGAYRCDVDPPVGTPSDYLMLHASVEADLDRWLLATEYLSGNLDVHGRWRAWHAHVGYQLTKRVSVHARGSIAQIDLPSNGHSLDVDLSEDLGLAINYAVHPNVLLKLEGHTNNGFMREDIPRDFYGPPSRTRYLIASVVASF